MSERHRRHANPFAIRKEIARPDLFALFGRIAPLEVEIGFGKGQFLLQRAAAAPNVNLFGLEIRPFLVEGVLEKAKATGLTNVAALHCNANTALTSLFKPGEVSRFYVNFPDPWYKKRHHKRRVVNTDTATMLRDLLTADGEIHAMSDFEPIALDMRESLEAAGLVNTAGTGQFLTTPSTPYTSEREDWHLSQNDPVYRMCFKRPDAGR